jgi:hypothetical protein
MKRFALAIALACVLCGPALAGDAHTVGAPAPAPIAGENQGSGIAAKVILTILSLVR